MRISELTRYRENGLMNPKHLISYEKLRFKRELTRPGKKKKSARLLPKAGDYSIQVLILFDIVYEKCDNIPRISKIPIKILD